MPTAKQFCDLLIRAVKEKWGYVWGLDGEKYTKAMAEKFKKNKRSPPKGNLSSTYWTVRCKKWFGKMAADCGGLIVWALRTLGAIGEKTDLGSAALISCCKKRGKVAKGVPNVDGLILYKLGHVAVLVDGKVLEAKGTDIGVVYGVSKVSSFTDWGYLPYLEYPKEAVENVAGTTRNGICTGYGVNVRKKPSAKSKSLKKLNKGDPIQYIETNNPSFADGYFWVKITEPIVGYMAKDFVAKRK